MKVDNTSPKSRFCEFILHLDFCVRIILCLIIRKKIFHPYSSFSILSSIWLKICIMDLIMNLFYNDLLTKSSNWGHDKETWKENSNE